MNNDSQNIDDDDSPIGIGFLPNVEKINRIRPHLRYDNKISQINDELLPDIEKNKNNGEKSMEGEIAVDVYETGDFIYIIAPIGGINASEIELTITDDVLHIRGSRSLGKEIPPQNYLVRECFWGRCSRSIILPPDADIGNITAKEKNAVLTIKIGRQNRPKSRIIEIK